MWVNTGLMNADRSDPGKADNYRLPRQLSSKTDSPRGAKLVLFGYESDWFTFADAGVARGYDGVKYKRRVRVRARVFRGGASERRPRPTHRPTTSSPSRSHPNLADSARAARIHRSSVAVIFFATCHFTPADKRTCSARRARVALVNATDSRCAYSHSTRRDGLASHVRS